MVCFLCLEENEQQRCPTCTCCCADEICWEKYKGSTKYIVKCPFCRKSIAQNLSDEDLRIVLLRTIKRRQELVRNQTKEILYNLINESIYTVESILLHLSFLPSLRLTLEKYGFELTPSIELLVRKDESIQKTHQQFISSLLLRTLPPRI